jgi:GT2 family glycosyltransferase
MMSIAYPELSIIIVNWNTSDLLEKCLASLDNLSKYISIEIIVIDNGSADDSVDICEKKFPHVFLIKNGKNLGFGQANNQGILASKANRILLLNTDVIVHCESIRRMLTLMNENESIGVVGCRLTSPDGSYQTSCARFTSLKRVFVERLLLYTLSQKFPRMAMEPPYIESQTECDWVLGACMMIQKKEAAGWKIIFEPNARVVHLGKGSWQENKYSPTFLFMVGSLTFYKKYFSPFSCFVVKILFAAGAVLRLFIWIFFYLTKSEKKNDILLEIRSNVKALLYLANITVAS